MKKIIGIILTLVLTVSAVCFSASALFGTGGTIVASDVKMVKTGLIGQKVTFTDSDFKSALCISDFDTLKITKIPSSLEGTLLLSGRRVGEGREIRRKNIGGLVFVPATNAVSECAFSFTVDGGHEIECVLKFIDKVNYAPEAEAISTVKTQENITVFGQMAATDPEDDALEYIIVSYPKYGSVSVFENGKFSYTPGKDYTGEDKFTYVVRDEYGNYSSPVKVSLAVNERMCQTIYADMEERAEYNAAVTLTAMGIMGGQILGDDVYFNPDVEITKAEFVTLLMKSEGIKANGNLYSTYFDDDADIPLSLKPYVATAQRMGIINGDFEGGKLLFNPNDTITRYEAAKIMATLLEVDEASEDEIYETDENAPVWARAGLSAMYSLGIFDTDDAVESGASVTRADAAEYLYRIMNIE
ncbi:MAG: cadherin-like domain-containing protein [Clostridia bacterium]|nr:cadherin-like domain-containing protein [Clostridia bacterium]